MNKLVNLLLGLILLVMAPVSIALAAAPPATNPQNGAVGLNGHITGSAPTEAPTITTPTNGASFSSLPINVAGLCNSGLLVEIFKNNVFSGSTVCANNSYSLQIDLFSGKNDLTARQYDALNQASPDSATVSVTFNDQIASSGPRVAISSDYAKRGANPGAELSWPLNIGGGTAPYAISVNWGDGSDDQLYSQKFAGDFSVKHTYQRSGTYPITIKATDASGDSAFLQVVGVANGAVQQAQTTSTNGNNTIIKILWLPIIVLFILVISSFWLGRKHQLSVMKARMKQGQRPF